MQSRNRCAALISVIALTLLAFASVSHAQNSPSPDPHQIPVMDGGIGDCSANFVVTDNAGAPIYDAKIRVHIAYGFMYARKLDLEQATNTDGKARFIGLPSRTKRGLFFQASQGDREGSAFVDPDKTCKADLKIVLEKKTQ
jgi:hypothetical protein